MNLYRDMNAKFVRERQSDGTWRWWSTNPNLVWEAEIFSRNRNDQFRTADFMKDLYFTRLYGKWHNGKYPVIGNYVSNIFNGDTQPFVQKNLSVEIQRNKPFLIQIKKDIILVLVLS